MKKETACKQKDRFHLSLQTFTSAARSNPILRLFRINYSLHPIPAVHGRGSVPLPARRANSPGPPPPPTSHSPSSSPAPSNRRGQRAKRSSLNRKPLCKYERSFCAPQHLHWGSRKRRASGGRREGARRPPRARTLEGSRLTSTMRSPPARRQAKPTTFSRAKRQPGTTNHFQKWGPWRMRRVQTEM